jgi:hypothetical protein
LILIATLFAAVVTVVAGLLRRKPAVLVIWIPAVLWWLLLILFVVPRTQTGVHAGYFGEALFSVAVMGLAVLAAGALVALFTVARPRAKLWSVPWTIAGVLLFVAACATPAIASRRTLEFYVTDDQGRVPTACTVWIQTDGAQPWELQPEHRSSEEKLDSSGIVRVVTYGRSKVSVRPVVSNTKPIPELQIQSDWVPGQLQLMYGMGRVEVVPAPQLPYAQGRYHIVLPEQVP